MITISTSERNIYESLTLIAVQEHSAIKPSYMLFRVGAANIGNKIKLPVLIQRKGRENLRIEIYICHFVES